MNSSGLLTTASTSNRYRHKETKPQRITMIFVAWSLCGDLSNSVYKNGIADHRFGLAVAEWIDGGFLRRRHVHLLQIPRADGDILRRLAQPRRLRVARQVAILDAVVTQEVYADAERRDRVAAMLL